MERIRLEKSGQQFTFLPGEADKINRILGIALQMQDMEGLPTFIPYTPFKVRFFEDDTLALERTDDAKSSIKLTWGEVDVLMQTIDKAVPISVNDTVQSGNIGRRRSASVGTGEPYL